MATKIKLITDEDNFKKIDNLLRFGFNNFYESEFIELKKLWKNIIVENIRREEERK